MSKKKPKPPSKPPRLKPLSLDPLTPEEALAKFMSADPQKVEQRLRDEGVIKKKS
jgi:hypothetical protein